VLCVWVVLIACFVLFALLRALLRNPLFCLFTVHVFVRFFVSLAAFGI
jgi:hypothetical protein